MPAVCVATSTNSVEKINNFYGKNDQLLCESDQQLIDCKGCYFAAIIMTLFWQPSHCGSLWKLII